MDKLNSFESYEDPFIVFEVTPMVEDKGEVMEITNVALSRIEKLQNEQEKFIASKRKDMADSFDRIQNFNYIMF